MFQLSSVKDGTDITPAEDNECTDVKVEDDDDESPPELVDIDDSEFGGTEQFEEIDLSDDDDFVIGKCFKDSLHDCTVHVYRLVELAHVVPF